MIRAPYTDERKGETEGEERRGGGGWGREYVSIKHVQ